MGGKVGHLGRRVIDRLRYPPYNLRDGPGSQLWSATTRIRACGAEGPFPFSEEEEEKTTIESGWEEEASTTVEQGEVAEKIRSLALETPRPRGHGRDTRPTATAGRADRRRSEHERRALDDRPAGPGAAGDHRQATTPAPSSEIAPGKSTRSGAPIDNDIVLTDIAVSRKHFDLRYEDGRVGPRRSRLGQRHAGQRQPRGPAVHARERRHDRDRQHDVPVRAGERPASRGGEHRRLAGHAPARRRRRAVDGRRQAACAPTRSSTPSQMPPPAAVIGRPKTLPPPAPLRAAQSVGRRRSPPLGVFPADAVGGLDDPVARSRTADAWQDRRPCSATRWACAARRDADDDPGQGHAAGTVPLPAVAAATGYPPPANPGADARRRERSIAARRDVDRAGPADAVQRHAGASSRSRRTPQPQFSRRTKMILAGAGLDAVRRDRDRRDHQGLERRHHGRAARRDQTEPAKSATRVASPRRRPRRSSRSIPRPRRSPRRRLRPRHQGRRAGEDRAAKTEPPRTVVKTEPPRPGPPRPSPPRPSPPGRSPRSSPPRPSPPDGPRSSRPRRTRRASSRRTRRGSRRTRRASSRRTRAEARAREEARSRPMPRRRKAKAEAQFKAKQFTEAAAILRAAIAGADPERRDAICSRPRESTTQFGAATTSAWRPGPGPIDAFEKLQTREELRQQRRRCLRVRHPEQARAGRAEGRGRLHVRARTIASAHERGRIADARYGNGDDQIVRQKLESVAARALQATRHGQIRRSPPVRREAQARSSTWSTRRAPGTRRPARRLSGAGRAASAITRSSRSNSNGLSMCASAP